MQLDGELEILNEDLKNAPRVTYTLKGADGKRTHLKFKKDPPTNRLTGDQVSASGTMENGTLVLYSGASLTSKNSKTTSSSGSTSSGSSSTSIPVPNTFGAQYTLIILVNFQDDVVQPYATTDAQTMFSGQVNNFIAENSYGQASIVPTVVGWYTIPVSVTSCDLTQIATGAQNAAVAAGVHLANYTRYVYAFPQNNSCGFAGSSYVGGNPSQSWINGNALDLHTIDHEMGHAFGLWHSHALDCGTAATICSSGTVVEYGDRLDVMGTVQTASPDYTAFQKERLGWLSYGASPAIPTVTSSGSYTITAYEQGAGSNALKVLKSTDPTTGAKTWYYLEARQAVGFDAFLATSTYYSQNETAGVLFHIGTDGDGNSSQLLDMTPATPTATGWWDASLIAGQSFTDSGAGVTFTVTSVSSSDATVQITMNGGGSGAPSSSGALTTSVATNQSSYMPGQTVGITATVLSGTSPAAAVSVSATVTAPNGKVTTLSGTTGSAGTVLLSYKLSKSATAGTYQVGATAGSSTTSTSSAATTAPASTSFIVQ